VTSAREAPVAVQIADRVGEVAGAAFIAALAWHGRISGDAAAALIAALVGSGTGMRHGWGRSGSSGSAVGVVGLAWLHASHVLRGVALGALALAIAGCGASQAPSRDAWAVVRAARSALCSSAVDALLAGAASPRP
jgi:hypothetical protein